MAQSDLEDSIKQQSFKGSHNAYMGRDAIDVQLDGYNVWKVELDLAQQSSEIGLQVGHPDFVHLSCPTRPINDYLTEISSSSAASDRISFIYIEQKSCIPICYLGFLNFSCFEISDAELIQQTGAALKAALGASNFYTRSNWQADGQVWPSISTLLRRHKHFIPIYEYGGYDVDDPFFFTVAASKAELERRPYNAVINVAAGGLGDFGFGPRTPGKNYLWRSYCQPEDIPGIPTACQSRQQDYWDSDIANGINIIGINDYWADHTFTNQVVQPHPFYAGALAGSSNSFGTLLYPYLRTRLGEALQKVPTHGRLILTPDLHYPGAAIVDRPFAIETSSPGSVQIGAP